MKIGQKVEVRVIRIDPEERKIGLTLIQTHFDEEQAAGAPREVEEPGPALGALATQLRDLGERVQRREEEAKKGQDDEGEGESASDDKSDAS